MDPVALVGYVAAVCTTTAFLPQLVRAARTRSTRDISLWAMGILVVGIVLWLTYGALRGDAPLIAANVVTLAIALPIVLLKLRHG